MLTGRRVTGFAAALILTGLCFLALPGTASAACPDNNLVGYWPFTGNANDASDCNNDGTVSGATLISDVLGTANSAYHFDGVDDTIDLGSSASLKPALPITVSMMVREDCASTCRVLDTDVHATHYSGLRISVLASGQIVARYGDGDGSNYVTDSRAAWTTEAKLQQGVWTHLTVVVNGPTDFEFYLDGVPAPSGDVIYAYAGGALGYLGGEARLGGISPLYEGDLDEVRIYDRALSPGEIAALTPCVVGGLLGHWPIEGDATDATACQNDGTVSGATLVSDVAGTPDEAYEFDGSGDLIALGSSALLKPELPLTLAVRLRYDNWSFGRIFSSEMVSGANYSGFYLEAGSFATLAAGFGDGTGSATSDLRAASTSINVLSLGVWHHVVAVIRGAADIDIYIDGVPQGMTYVGSGGAMSYLVGAAAIGNEPNGTASLDGAIDDLRLYDRALSPSEVADLSWSCGDGLVRALDGEECDDGNTVSEDGCSDTCLVESCGDGVLQLGLGEACDDGNMVSEDGCSDVCIAEICGDSVIQAGLGETCDDGNAVSEDGCSDVCVMELCGDGAVQPGLGESCDDSNTASFDGCSDICVSESSVRFVGTGEGGNLDYTLAGVTVSVTTTNGQTAAQVAAALAAAINANTTLSGLGVVAGNVGDALVYSGSLPTAFDGTETGVAISTNLDSLLGDLSVIPRTLDFEAVLAGASVPDAGSLEGITFGYALDGATALVNDVHDAISPANSLGLSGGDDAFLDGDVLNFTLPRPVLALGLYVVTSDPAAAGEILLTTPHGSTGNSGIPDGTAPDGGHIYFIAHVAVEPFTTASLDFATDEGTHFVYTVDDMTAAVAPDGTCGFTGVAVGGHVVGATVDGVFVQISTYAGQTAAQVAQDLAAAINANTTLQSLGTAAVADGDQILTNGTIVLQTNTDPGLGGAPTAVPALAPIALGLLASLLIGAGALAQRGRRRA